MRLRHALTFVTTLALLAACTPKTIEQTTQTPTAPTTVSAPKADEKLSPCPKFTDAPNPGQVEDNYVIYRDFLGAGEVDKAYELWKTVYAVAPAADGRRNTVLTDGIYFMKYYASQTEDPAEQKDYLERVDQLYDQIEECYPGDGSMMGRKAFDCFYENRGQTPRECYDLFAKAIEADGEDSGDYILNPLAALTVQLHESGEITDAEARQRVDFINRQLAKLRREANTSTERERLALIEGYVPDRLAYFEQVAGFYDCQYFKDKYLPEFEEARDDYVRLSQLAGYLRFGGCPAGDADLQRIVTAARAVQPVDPTPRGNSCFDLIRDAKYSDAVSCLEDSYNNASDEAKKAQYALVIAKLNYGNLRNFPAARTWARKAAGHKSGWGEPYVLIGKLYASSGPLCGSGTGFESQRVVWVAIDQWNKAKSVDPGVASEAQRLINRYAQYMPAKDDLFMNGIKPGSSYTVPCWINESTTVRAK